MDWASHTQTQTTVTPARTDPGYDPRGADASPDREEEEEEPKKKKTFQKSKQTEDGQWRYCTTEHLHFVFLLFFLNIMSDQKLSDNNELRPLALDGS